MKAYTTLEESKVLVEAGLDPKTADMYYSFTGEHIKEAKPENFTVHVGKAYAIQGNHYSYQHGYIVPCWSLAALLTVLENPKIFYRLECTSGLSIELHVSGTGFSEYFEEPVNAILWLLENKKL